MPLIVIPFILIALIALGLAFVAWQRSRAPGSSSFALMMLAIAVWLLTVVIQITVASQPEKDVWAKIGYMGIGWIGTLWLSFALEFTHPENRFLRQVGNWLSLIPIITLFLIITNDQHSLMWTHITPLYSSGRLDLVASYGVWFWLYAIYSYLVLILGAVILLSDVLRHPQINRWQVVGLVGGIMLPWTANLIYVFAWPVPMPDLTPFAFALTGIIYAWILYRLGLFDLMPLAHEAILKNVNEGYLILDMQGRVIEMNALATRWLGIPDEKALGSPADQALAGWPQLLTLLKQAGPAQAQAGWPAQVEFAIESDPAVHLEATLTPWYHRDRRLAGQLIILYDITRRWQAEQQLRQSERLYRLLVNTSPVGIVLMDPAGKVTFVSPKTYELFNAHDLTTQSAQWMLDRVYPEDRPIGEERMRMLAEMHEPLQPQEYRLMRDDGSIFWGEVNSVPTVDEQGKMQGLLAIIHDITARKSLELQLKDHLARQTFTNDLLQILYRPRDLTEALSQALALTGRFFEASRVYLCQNSPDGLEMSLRLEWCRPPLRPRAQDSVLVRYAEIKSWQGLLDEQGMIAISRPEDAPPDIADFMSIWSAQSLAAFPVYGREERLDGFLGLEFCDQAHAWTGEELDHLWNVCRIVSGAVAQRQIEMAEHRQRMLAEALHDTSSALNSTLNFEEVLDRILANLGKVVQHDAASIALVDEDNNVYFVRWRGYDAAGDAAMRAFRAPVGERGTYRWMALTGEPVIIADTWLDKRWVLEEHYAWIRSYAGVPIQIKGKVAGFINLDSGEPDVFNPDLVYSLHVFAEQAAVAIENSRLYDAVHRRVEGMTTLNRIAMTLTAGLDMDQILVSLFEQCSQVLPIDVFYVALFDAETGAIDFPFFYREGLFETLGPRNIHQAAGVTGEVIRRRQTIHIPDAAVPEAEREYHLIHLGGQPARSYVGVPLILLDQVVGVISMQSLQPYAYTSEQVNLLQTIATQAAIAVQNARLYDQMKQLAITDSVTLLYTRRHFTTLGRSEVERALRYNRVLSVMMVDIDHFKQVNDTYGHNSGDIVLQVVAMVTRQALRATDLIGRWGGEEFVLVLPEADQSGALLIAERIRRMVADAKIPLPEATIQVTISIGVSTLSKACSSLDALVDCADRAMYLAKQGGRNQVRAVDP